MKYHVLRRHIGDKLYEEGDEREADEGDVAHLVKNGVLQPSGQKAEPAVKNKAEKPLKNKAAK